MLRGVTGVKPLSPAPPAARRGLTVKSVVCYQQITLGFSFKLVFIFCRLTCLEPFTQGLRTAQ